LECKWVVWVPSVVLNQEKGRGKEMPDGGIVNKLLISEEVKVRRKLIFWIVTE